ncbi:MAG: sigma-54-dependent Fis family transcriptional regulator [Gammaproteobacteria bacterium]|nr:sigma-54-dependent Fis family transcriptional regulator [Gammaproteobacteria bacterium]
MRAPHVLVVDDEADIRHLIQEILTEEGYDVTIAANAAEAREAIAERTPDMVLLDIWMPDTDGISLLREWQEGGRVHCPVVMLSGHGTVETAVETTRLGAADFVEKPLSLNKLLRTVEKTLRGVRPTPRGGPARGMMPPIVTALGRSRRIRELRQVAEQLALHNAPVLIIGEPGTGRGLLARFIHASAPRRDEPFMVVAGASLVADNAAGLILGVDRPGGAEPGCIAQAGAGTLYVSNLEDASAPAQALLGAVIETGRYTPLGRAAQQETAVRVLASVRPATAADPAAHGVRPDLLARIGVLRIEAPPLREYAEDISEILRYTADDLVDREHLTYRRFGFAAQNRLRNYPWPGNLRELTGLVHRLLAAGGPEEIGLGEVEKELVHAQGAQEPLVKQDLLAMPLREAREHFERAYLTEQLALCGGKVGQLARRVGMERTHLYRKLRSLGVELRGTLTED